MGDPLNQSTTGQSVHTRWGGHERGTQQMLATLLALISPSYCPDCRPEDSGLAHIKPVHYSLQGGLSHTYCYLYP
jgi:hypothetical protein